MLTPERCCTLQCSPWPMHCDALLCTAPVIRLLPSLQKVSICSQVAFGETHKIVGGHPSIGDWNVDAAPAMNWSDGDVWSLDVNVPSGTGLEFKA